LVVFFDDDSLKYHLFGEILSVAGCLSVIISQNPINPLCRNRNERGERRNEKGEMDFRIESRRDAILLTGTCFKAHTAVWRADDTG
jgi:hypothetical protein